MEQKSIGGEIGSTRSFGSNSEIKERVQHQPATVRSGTIHHFGNFLDDRNVIFNRCNNQKINLRQHQRQHSERWQ